MVDDADHGGSEGTDVDGTWVSDVIGNYSKLAANF